tara:strand:- start:1471 stop:1980 length:510 start_codon:yes stop_codon:yes gene_type:complete
MKRILKVQEQIGVLGKDSKNPFFKSAYLDLNKLLINVTPLLHKEGLILSQPIRDGLVYSEILDAEACIVLLSSSIKIPENLTDPQKLGSCITYFRRYTLKSLLAIAEGDDDANLAAKPEPKKVNWVVNPRISLEDAKDMKGLAEAYGKLTKEQQLAFKALKDALKLKLK